MYTTRIDEDLQFHHLIQAVAFLDLAMGEYFGLLSAIVARNGCRDGESCEQKVFSGPVGYAAEMLNPMMFNKTPLFPSRNYMLRLDHLGIEPDEYFASDEYFILCQDGVDGLPLKVSGGIPAARDFGAQFFAFKWAPHHEDEGEAIEETPPLNSPIEQVIPLDHDTKITENFYVSPAIIIPAEKYDVWERPIKEIVNWLLMILQPLFPQPLLLPNYDYDNIWFPYDGRIKLVLDNSRDGRIKPALDKKSKSTLPKFDMAIDPLKRYVAHVRMHFELIWQEINRKQIKQAPNNRVHIVLDASDKLHQLTVDGKPQPITGKFSNGAKLLMSLWNAPEHRLAKADIKDTAILYKGKEELQGKIGPAVFADVYQDDIRGGDIWLTDKIIVETLSTSKR